VSRSGGGGGGDRCWTSEGGEDAASDSSLCCQNVEIVENVEFDTPANLFARTNLRTNLFAGASSAGQASEGKERGRDRNPLAADAGDSSLNSLHCLLAAEANCRTPLLQVSSFFLIFFFWLYAYLNRLLAVEARSARHLVFSSGLQFFFLVSSFLFVL
jgi:hypothetical protein